ncbi:MAG: hypothetical protein A2287_01090 [Candidatus Melainabacteria bacterium RIFOXYA12_FULL_32_12]|nr:MAG: hypothetical protein A2287_01090 [Candidatus Melainabacteria bacterium RIFOXYA12_FULL_32_12]
MISKIQNYIAKAAEYNMRKPDDFIKYTGAAVNAFYYTCQATAFAKSKNIPEEKKKFVVSQEIGEGVLSTGITLYLASKFKDFGKSLVDKAKILPQYLPKDLRNPESVKNILNNTTEYTAKLTEFRGLIGTASTVVGIVLAYTVATPILRNIFANFINKGNKKDNTQIPTEMINQNIFKDFLTAPKKA